MKYRLVIFDLDGTLSDSLPWFRRIVNSVAGRHKSGIRFGAVTLGYATAHALRSHAPDEMLAGLDEIVVKLA